ncbi:YcaO-like family protein [Desulfobacterales bacterium HSG16]|nr:YcaO-like family protein [Desulfobacterales bacterium HSG16]
MEKYKIILQDAYKQSTLDQDKIIAPEKTVNHFFKKLDSIDLDILEKTERIDNGRLDIPVYFSTCGKDALKVTGTRKQMGKGGTPSQAEASAVMELSERFSFFSFFQNPDNFITAPLKAIEDKTMDFSMIAKSVHDSSADLDISRQIFENIPLRWTWAFNLTRQEEMLIPFDWFYAINEFNGPSAGNCTEEALSQGICEIVERHVSSQVSHNNLNVPLIDPESADDPMVREILGKYNNAGIKLYLSDFSMNMGIPTVGVLAWDPSTFPEKSEIVWTAGTTPDPQKALSRALTETAQLAGDFNTGSNYIASGLPKPASIKDISFITDPGKSVPIANLPNISDNNIKIEVEKAIAALANRKMDVIAVNTMHNKLQIPAFYTIIPGAYFRERAQQTSVAMFSAKLITENFEPGKAFQELERINRILPGKYFVQFYMGTTSLSMNDPDTALDHFQKALKLDPVKEDIPSIYSYMGVCLKDTGRYAQAIEVLKKGEAIDQDRTDIYNTMGFCHFMLKEHEKAIGCFENVLRIDPGSAIDYANIASNYRDMGEKEKAIEYYHMALAIDPSIEFAKDNLVRLLS